MSDTDSSESGDYLLLTKLADDFAARYRAGERPKLQEYVDRYPELADEIRELLPTMVVIERVKADEPEAAGKSVSPSVPALERLGDFRILREVGNGGMGIVYEAEQVSLGRHVALKVLPRSMLLDNRARRRFEREAKSAARLHHTNIVPVFGVGEQDGLPYSVMQFIQGLGLDAVLEELKKLQNGQFGTGSIAGGGLRVSRNSGNPNISGGCETTAADVARSLLTGVFGPIEGDTATVEADDGRTFVATENHPSEPAGKRNQEPAASSLPSDSLRMSSSSSVMLPAGNREGNKTSPRAKSYWHSVAAIGSQVADELDYALGHGVLHRDIKPSGSDSQRSRDYSISSVIVRESTTGNVVHTLTGHTANVLSMAFSPDGSRLTTASYDRTVKIWDMKTGKDLFTLLGHTAGVMTVGFSPNVHQLVSGGIDFTCRVWNAEPLPATVTAEHDARYRRKVQTMEQLNDATDDLVRARILSEEGKWNLAAEALDVAVIRKPADLEVRFRQIETLVMLGEPARVRHACDEARALFAGSDDPLRKLILDGVCDLAEGANSDALKKSAMRKIIATSDDIDRILALGNLGDWSVVSANLEKIAGQRPGDVRCRFVYALALVQQRKYDEGIASFREAIRIDPKFDEAYAYLGWTYRDLGRFSDALAAFETGFALAEKRIPAGFWNDWVTKTRRLKEFDASLPDYLNGDIQVDSRDDYHDLAEVCFAKRANVDGARFMTEASKADPADTMMSLRLAAVQAWLGLDKDFAETRKRILAYASDTREAAIAERGAKACSILPGFGTSDAEEAMKLARNGIELDPGGQLSGWPQLALGMAPYRLGDDEDALKALKAAIDIMSDIDRVEIPELSLTSSFYQAMCLHRIGQAEEARQLAK